MKKLSMLSAAVLAATCFAAIAAEPVQLSDAQMATVVAGAPGAGLGLGILTASWYNLNGRSDALNQVWSTPAAVVTADVVVPGGIGNTSGGLITAGKVPPLI